LKCGRRWRRFLFAFLATIAAAWMLYKATTIRALRGRATVATGCESDASTVAEMGRFRPGAAAIRCQPWDVGTGVAGYAWHAMSPRAAVVIEHGWGDYAQRYVNQFGQLIPRLLARGVTVYAIDMWGNGRSPGARGATDLESAVDDHLAARRRLRDQPLPVFLLGHSVGGLVTATSTLRDPSGVRGMILIAPALKWDLGGAMRAVARTAGFLLPTFQVPAPPADPSAQSRDPRLHERLVRDPFMVMGPVTWATVGSGAAISHANWTQYRKVTVPILILNGTDDLVTSPAGAREFFEVVRSEDKTLRILDGGRHSLLDDPPSNAEALQTILEWLERRLPRSDAATR
jgi:alpha-beta hydrolase superfamily lysophospholipase